VPISEIMTVTRADGHVVMEIDGKKPFDVFSDVLKKMTIDKIGKNPDEIFVKTAGGRGEGLEIPDEFKNVFKGEVHIALPVAGSDIQDYMVRDIVGIDPEEGVMAVSQKLEAGDRLMFVHRDDDTVKADLSHMLVGLRQRVLHENNGIFAPKAALYFTCIARAKKPFTVDGRDELALVRDIIGDVPLTGFYANGEISGGRHYRYTGVLVLFL
jgi:small ligand-binding sensory domain FIST